MGDIRVVYKNAQGLDNEHNEATDSIKLLSLKTANHELTDSKLGALINGGDASTEHSHDSIYFRENEFIDSSAGVSDAAKPIKSNTSGKVSNSLIDVLGLNALLDHGSMLGLSDDDHTQYLLASGARNLTGIQSYATHPSFNDGKQLVDKQYVDDKFINDEWYQSVNDILLSPPLSPNTGDRYLINGVGTGAWAGKDNQVAEWNGSAWIYQIPTNGVHLSVDTQQSFVYIFNGTSWDQKSYESTTASNGLVKVGNDIRIDSGAAGNGLGFSAGVLSVNVDNSSIEINSDSLRVKAAGIKDTMIDFGTGVGQVSAADMPIADVGNYFPLDNVESALQKLAQDITQQGVEYTVGIGGVLKGDAVIVTSNNTVVKHSTITDDDYVVGVAMDTVAEGGTVKVLANDTALTAVLVGAVAGQKVYWTGTGYSFTIPTGSNKNIWRVGIAKNTTDLSVEVDHVKKNA